MKKLYNRTALFHARAIVGLFALCLLALPSPALAQAIDLKLTNVTVKEAIEALRESQGRAKTAIVMVLLHIPASEAEDRLTAAQGYVAAVLKEAAHGLR